MLTCAVLRLIAWLVLLTFTSLTLQPLQAAAQMPGSGEPPPVPQGSDERYSQGLAALRETLERAEDKAGRGAPVDEEVAAALSKNKTLEALEPAVDASFAATEQHLKDHHLPPEILERHRAAVQELKAKQQELKRLLQDLEDADKAKDETGRRAKVQALADFLKQHQHKKPHTPVDPHKLPLRTPEAKVRPPKETAQEFQATLFKPAPVRLAGPVPSALPPAGLSPTPTPEDLAETEDVQLTQAIRDLAASLDKSPVKIFNWVRNNIEFLPTYGAIQGSDLTLQTQRGNAFDTASLLIALLRASNIPARYVYGTIQVPIDQAMNWVGGVTQPEAALNLLGQGGIPSIGLVSGGAFKAVKLEHVWVEAFVDYVPSRGAVNREGDTWVPLDAAFKQYQFTPGMDLKDAVPFDAQALVNQVKASAQINEARGWATGIDPSVIDSALSTDQDRVLAYIASTKPDATLGDVFGTQTIIAREDPILLGSLPYKRIATGSRFAAIPSTLRHSVTLNLYASDLDRALESPALAYTTSLPALSSRRLGVTYAPASAADAQLIQSYQAQGASSLPVYLIRVKPLLQIDGVTVASGEAIGMGEPQFFEVTLADPQGLASTPTSFNGTAGDEIVFGVNGNGITPEVVLERLARVSSDTAAENLHQVALHYWMEHDVFDRLAAQAQGAHTQRLPSVGQFSSPLTVRFFFGIPRSGSYRGRQMDVKRVLLAAVAPSDAARRAFLHQAGLQGSFLEGNIFDQLFARPLGKSVSAAQLLTDASRLGIPVSTITPANAASLADLMLSPEVEADLANALNAGQWVIAPQRDVVRADYTGVGYIILDPQTGAGAYLIDGGLNGGGQKECIDSASPQTAGPLSPEQALLIGLMKTTEETIEKQLRDQVIKLIWTTLRIGPALGPVGWVVLASLLIITAYYMYRLAVTERLCEGGDATDCKCLPEPKPPQCQCKIEPACPHKGNDEIHNQCADFVGPNKFPTCDVLVITPGGLSKRFDSMSPDGTTVWEVKTNRWQDFLQYTQIPRDIRDAQRSIAIAHECKLSYNYAVADSTHYLYLQNRPGFIGNIVDKLELVHCLTSP